MVHLTSQRPVVDSHVASPVARATCALAGAAASRIGAISPIRQAAPRRTHFMRVFMLFHFCRGLRTPPIRVGGVGRRAWLDGPEHPAARRGVRGGGPFAIGAEAALGPLSPSGVEPLPAATRRTLLLAALDGTGDLGVLVAAFGGTAIDDLAPAQRAPLVRGDGERRRLAFQHPLMRSPVAASSTPPERRGPPPAIPAPMAGAAVRPA